MSIEQEITNIITDTVLITKEEIHLESSLIGDLGFDTTDFYEVIMEIEEKYDINISDDDMTAMKTFKDMVDYVEKAIKTD